VKSNIPRVGEQSTTFRIIEEGYYTKKRGSRRANGVGGRGVASVKKRNLLLTTALRLPFRCYLKRVNIVHL